MAFDTVERAVEEIARLSPAFMSVTYGAGGTVFQSGDMISAQSIAASILS